MQLIEITRNNSPAASIDNLPEIARSVVRSTVEMYRSAGYQPPWVGYLAVDEGECVGTCAFKAAPENGRVEIAYFTFPGNEGRGVATGMAESLIKIAKREAPKIRVSAQTPPEQNASTRVLEKLGFLKMGEFEHPEDGMVWEWELTEKAQQGTVLDGDSAALAPHQ